MDHVFLVHSGDLYSLREVLVKHDIVNRCKAHFKFLEIAEIGLNMLLLNLVLYFGHFLNGINIRDHLISRFCEFFGFSRNASIATVALRDNKFSLNVVISVICEILFFKRCS